MEGEKMSTFYSSSTKLTQSNCLAPPNTVPHLQLSPTTGTHTTTPMQSSAQLSLSLKVEPAVSANAFLEPPSNSSASTSSAPCASTYNDPFAAYADNFDLSLLPQDCAQQTNGNIPTIVYQFGCNTQPTTPTTLSPASVPFHNLLTPPQIKVEQAWSFGSTISLPEEFKREPQASPMLKSANQLIPPPPYPHIYPSPQSSPAQSEYGFPQTQFAGCFESLSSSLSSSRSSLHTTSPYPSLDACNIKQELHILPPSPPESNCEAPSPHSSWPDIKSEPLDADVETLIDLNMLLDKKEFSSTAYTDYNNSNSECHLKPAAAMPVQQHQQQQQQQQQQKSQDQQMLREFFEENHFPMGCSMHEVGDNIEQVISMALEDTKSLAVETCAKLQISQDPCDWSVTQAHSWLRSTVAQFKLPEIEDLEAKFPETGAALILLSEEEFKRRVPESGSDLYAQLEVWRYHFNSNAAESDDDEDMLPTTSALAVAGTTTTTTTTKSADTKRTGRSGGSHIHLWQFLKELLAEPHAHGTAIRWIDRNRGIFKIEDSVRVAKLWGGRKNRPAMNYDKLSRSIRQYYKKGIMKKTERSQRLVYQFCHPYQL
ncbi:DNA-binding protein D-ETS-4 isoform X1 [Zeugodacus cucurbitae]|uniref:DNA-binding protein D-ETS-4 isoform X1 n=2 Tax=Zeugodacus cucurbitae TaxID=28588 RepID=UPI0023D923E1|nr:DNA-binding protein D-ETS-4 isoform X1 [Zeugodacus cucurbitae]